MISHSELGCEQGHFPLKMTSTEPKIYEHFRTP